MVEINSVKHITTLGKLFKVTAIKFDHGNSGYRELLHNVPEEIKINGNYYSVGRKQNSIAF